MFAFFAGLLACVSAINVPTVKLNNGANMPVIAFAANVWSFDTCKDATTAAIDVGFRFIWSSVLVGEECQKAQGEVIATSSVREDLYIAGTVNTGSCSGFDRCYTKSLADGKQQLATLGVKFLDMLMLDYPAKNCDSILGQWAALTELVSVKQVATIAVSNFSPSQLDCVISNSTITPAVNQLYYSLANAGNTHVADNAKRKVVVQAYSPLANGQLPLDPLCIKIGQAHNKSGAQVALRWIIQTNATIATQSTNPAYLKEDIDIFDFELTSEEMNQLNNR